MAVTKIHALSVLAVSAVLALPGCRDDGADPLGVQDSGGGSGGDGDGDGDGDGMHDPDPDPDDVDDELPDPESYDYTVEHVFSALDVIGHDDGVTAADDPSIVCFDCTPREEGSAQMYPIDSSFGFDVVDFVGATARGKDGDHAEGWIGDIADPETGEHQGVAVSSQATPAFRTGALAGSWCAGAGADLVKCSTEQFTVMEHILTCDETIPYWFYDPQSGEPNRAAWEACEPLDTDYDVDPTQLEPYEFDLDQVAYTTDFSVSQKDDGKVLYRWGTWEKRPTDVRLVAHMPLPEAWHDREYVVTRAELAVVHTISNSPNDQIRPEGLENEAATGRKPGYEVLEDGRWVSTVDCYEGDGDFIPAGTTLRNPDWADEDGLSSDLRGGYTNAWYTTTDRHPFEDDPSTGVGPRWRFKSAKFGQNLPGVDIPAVNCTPPPLRKGETAYEVGEATVTTINLLDWHEGEDSPLSKSSGWTTPTIQQMNERYEGVTADGLQLTKDFDLSLYVKGEYKAARVYRAVLYLSYEEA